MTIFLAPVDEQAPEKLSGRMYRKQILKSGDLNYTQGGKSRVLHFTKSMFDDIVSAFHKKAYDTVPFMLAEKDNSHTMRPERQAGEVVDMEATSDGLYGIIRLSESGASIVNENSKFGVSARIKENLERGDGFKASAAIQHVLGTFDPRVTGLAPWEAVELSDEGDEVVDLTSTERTSAMAELTGEQIAKLAKLADSLNDDTDADDANGVEDTDDEMTEEEAQAILDALEADASKEKEPAGASLSNEDDDDDDDRDVLLSEIRELKATSAKAEWATESKTLLNEGVPPAMLKVAEMLLSSPDVGEIDLANGKKIDPRKVVRDILAEAKGVVDLSERRGHLGADSDSVDKEYKALSEAWNSEL